MALSLGKTVKEIITGMDVKEFYSWLIYYNEKPFGDYRADLRSGMMTQILASPYLKENSPSTLGDFMLNFDEAEAPSQDDLIAKLKGMLPNAKKGEDNG